MHTIQIFSKPILFPSKNIARQLLCMETVHTKSSLCIIYPFKNIRYVFLRIRTGAYSLAISLRFLNITITVTKYNQLKVNMNKINLLNQFTGNRLAVYLFTLQTNGYIPIVYLFNKTSTSQFYVFTYSRENSNSSSC